MSRSVILDSRAEMQNRLRGLDLSHHVEMFFVPLLMDHAGKHKTGEEVATMLLDAINTFAELHAIEYVRRAWRDTMLMRERAAAILLALVHEDEDVRNDAWGVIRTKVLD